MFKLAIISKLLKKFKEKFSKFFVWFAQKEWVFKISMAILFVFAIKEMSWIMALWERMNLLDLFTTPLLSIPFIGVFFFKGVKGFIADAKAKAAKDPDDPNK